MTAGPVDWLHRTTPVGYFLVATALTIALAVIVTVAWGAYRDRRRPKTPPLTDEYKSIFKRAWPMYEASIHTGFGSWAKVSPSFYAYLASHATPLPEIPGHPTEANVFGVPIVVDETQTEDWIIMPMSTKDNP